MPDILAEVRGDWLGAARTGFLERIHSVVARTLGSPTDEPVAASDVDLGHDVGATALR